MTGRPSARRGGQGSALSPQPRPAGLRGFSTGPSGQRGCAGRALGVPGGPALPSRPERVGSPGVTVVTLARVTRKRCFRVFLEAGGDPPHCPQPQAPRDGWRVLVVGSA